MHVIVEPLASFHIQLRHVIMSSARCLSWIIYLSSFMVHCAIIKTLSFTIDCMYIARLHMQNLAIIRWCVPLARSKTLWIIAPARASRVCTFRRSFPPWNSNLSRAVHAHENYICRRWCAFRRRPNYNITTLLIDRLQMNMCDNIAIYFV